MKYVGLSVALAGLVSLSLFDWLLGPLFGSSFLWRPGVGSWGLICSVFLLLTVWMLRLEQSHKLRFKAAGVGFVSPILAVVIGHHGFATVLWLYLPMSFGLGIHWLLHRKPARVAAASEAYRQA